MNLAYLTNQYPRTSHSFIRREVQALEAMGETVHRFSVQPVREPLVEPADQAEQGKTRVLLAGGSLGLVAALVGGLLRRPWRFFRALGSAVRLGRVGRRGVLYHLAYLAEACRLQRWLAEVGAEHLHAHFGTNSTTVALLCRQLGGPPFSFTVHGPEEFDDPHRLSLSEKVAACAFVVAISSFGRSQLMRWSPFEQWGKIHVIHCGLDAMFLNPPSEPAQARGDEPQSSDESAQVQFVCVGRLCEQKGQGLLLEAFALARSRGMQAELTLAGDGDMRQALERRVEQLGLQDAVRITGWLSGEQVRSAMLAADVMVLASFAEGLPVVLMEAMALSRPVISTYVAGIPELVRDGEVGWLIPAGDAEALADALATAAATEPDRRQQMGEAGRQRVLARHDVATEAGKLRSLFAQAVGGGSSPDSPTSGASTVGGAGERAVT